MMITWVTQQVPQNQFDKTTIKTRRSLLVVFYAHFKKKKETVVLT